VCTFELVIGSQAWGHNLNCTEFDGKRVLWGEEFHSFSPVLFRQEILLNGEVY
jgi:hypothetical protein